MADPSEPTIATMSVRLKKRRDFLHVAGGRKSHSALFTVQARPQADAGEMARVGLTVTKKVGNAVERNRVKRRLREVLRTETLPLNSTHDYVIVARRPVLSASFAALGRGLRSTIAKADGGGRPRDRAPRS